jgi:hypothetical protein
MPSTLRPALPTRDHEDHSAAEIANPGGSLKSGSTQLRSTMVRTSRRTSGAAQARLVGCHPTRNCKLHCCTITDQQQGPPRGPGSVSRAFTCPFRNQVRSIWVTSIVPSARAVTSRAAEVNLVRRRGVRSRRHFTCCGSGVRRRGVCSRRHVTWAGVVYAVVASARAVASRAAEAMHVVVASARAVMSRVAEVV